LKLNIFTLFISWPARLRCRTTRSGESRGVRTLAEGPHVGLHAWGGRNPCAKLVRHGEIHHQRAVERATSIQGQLERLRW